jgi:hypothetical protein
MKTYVKKMLLLSVGSICILILLALGYARGILSPRELGIALLIMCIVIGTGAAVIIREAAARLRSTGGQAQPSEARATIPLARLRAIAGFVFSGGLLILLAPYVIYMASTKVIPWVVAIIAIPAYAILSYGAFRLLRAQLARKPAATLPGDHN